MRIAVVSDVHGNLTALDAVIADLKRERPDLVMHAGDLVLSGPRPAEVVDLIRGLGWPGVVGNTDELLWRPEELSVQEGRAPRLRTLLHILFKVFAPSTLERLGQERTAWLRELPQERRVQDIAILHASPGDLWRAPMPDADECTLLEVYGRTGSRLVVHGHIHRPYVRAMLRLTVANCGSVGSPYDGDWRASYILIDDSGEPAVKRVEYDIEHEIIDLRMSNHPYAPWLAEMRRRGVFIPPPTPEQA